MLDQMIQNMITLFPTPQDSASIKNDLELEKQSWFFMQLLGPLRSAVILGH